MPKKIGYPIIIKLLDGSQGRGVKKIKNENGLLLEIDNINLGITKGVNFVVQEYNSLKDIRVIYLDSKIELVYMRLPAVVVGNGIYNLEKLIYDKYKDKKIEINIETISYYLNNQGFALSDVIEYGQKVQFVPIANVSTGGDVLTYEFDEEDEKFVTKIANIFGARYFGLDILITGKICKGSVLEINKMPDTKVADLVEPGFGKKLGSKIRQIIKQDEGIL